MIWCAGSWLICSPYIERMMHRSSATPPMCGKISVISCPDLPYFLNAYCGAKHISFWRCSCASCCPFVNDSGIGSPFIEASFGL